MPAPRGSTLDRPAPAPARATASDRAARIRFRRAVALLVMTLVVPGSAQLSAGNRRVGRLVIRVWVTTMLLLLAAGVVSFLWRGAAFWAVSDTRVLLVLRLLLTAYGVAWAALFVDAWRIGQPLTLRRDHRRAIVVLNSALALTVAGAMLFSAHLVGVQRAFIATMFGSSDVVGAFDGRYNVLLLGGDSGAGRWGLRPDSLTVASIDARTGSTVLISLPRNLADFPFARGSVMREQFPQGFDCDGCYLNGVSTWAQDRPELFGDSETPGVDATVMGVEGITGLQISYWAMVNLQGFRDLVDAVGGVELNVRQPIPVGGLGDDVTGYIEPGLRTLDGFETLWFARARDDSDDYSRMARQKCVMNAMLNQVSPQVALRNFQDIAEASSAMMSTNVPASEVGRFLDLALKAKSQKIATLSLVPPMIDTADPDVQLVREKVRAALGADEPAAPAPARAETTKPGTPARPPAPQAEQPVTGGSIGSMSEGYAANEADDLGAVC